MKQKKIIFVLGLMALFYLPSLCFADWCDGRKFRFLPMDKSERIKQALAAVALEKSRLTDLDNRLLYDISGNFTTIRETMTQENEKLARDSISLCRRIKTMPASGLEYNGILLRDLAEAKAQTRMNLAAIHANQVVMEDLDGVTTQYKALKLRIREKLNEMAVIHKSLERLSDGRIEGREQDFESVFRTACVSLGQAEELRMNYQETTKESLFKQAAEKSSTRHISSDILDQFLNTCDLSLKWTVAGQELGNDGEEKDKSATKQ